MHAPQDNSRLLQAYCGNVKSLLNVKGIPWVDFEVDVHPALRYAHDRFPKAEFWQIAAEGTKDFQTTHGIHVCPAVTFLRHLA